MWIEEEIGRQEVVVEEVNLKVFSINMECKVIWHLNSHNILMIKEKKFINTLHSKIPEIPNLKILHIDQ